VVAAAESQGVVRAAQGQRARAARGARRGDVHVAGHRRGRRAGQRRGAGVAGEEFIGAREGSVGPQVAKQLLRRGEALVAGSVGRHPVADVRLGVVGEHEAVGVQGVAGQRGRRGAGQRGVDAVQGVRGVDEGVSGLEGLVVGAGGPGGPGQVAGAVVAQAVRVSAQAGRHHRRRRGARQRARPGRLAAAQAAGGGQLGSHQAGGFGGVQSHPVRQELRRVAGVGSGQRPRVAHARRRQGEDGLARLVGGDGGHQAGAQDGGGGGGGRAAAAGGGGGVRGDGLGARRALLVLPDLRVNPGAADANPAVADAAGARASLRAGAAALPAALRLLLLLAALPLGRQQPRRAGGGGGAGAACPGGERLAGGARHPESRLLPGRDPRRGGSRAAPRLLLLRARLGVRLEARLVLHADVAELQRARLGVLLASGAIGGDRGEFGGGGRVRLPYLRASLRQEGQGTLLRVQLREWEGHTETGI